MDGYKRISRNYKHGPKFKMRIGLVTGRSGSTLVRHLVKLGHDVFLVSGSKLDSGYELARDSYIRYIPKENYTKSHIQDLVEFLVHSEIDGFILGTGVWFAHDIAKELHEKGIRVSHDIFTIDVFKNKLRTKDLFVQNSFSVARHVTDLASVNELTFPIVLKSNIDLFAVCKFDDKQTLIDYVNSLDGQIISRGLIIEEYLEGSDATIPIFIEKNGKCFSPGVVYWSKQSNYKLEGFEEYRQQWLDKETEKDLVNIAKSFIQKMDYYGVCRFDIRFNEEKIVWLEINSVVSIRNSGSSFKALEAVGVNYVELALETYLNNIRK